MKRYQKCNKLEKIWRCRWYLATPLIAFWKWISKTKVGIDEEIDGKLVHTDKCYIASWKLCWRIALGDIGTKMNYYYTMEEVEKHFEELLKKK